MRVRVLGTSLLGLEVRSSVGSGRAGLRLWPVPVVKVTGSRGPWRWDGGRCQVAGRGSGCSGSRCWAGTGGVGGSWRLAVAPGEGAGCAGRCALGLVGAGGAGSVRCGCACAEPSGVRLRPEARRERLRPARRLVRRPGQPPAVAAAGIGSAGPPPPSALGWRARVGSNARSCPSSALLRRMACLAAHIHALSQRSTQSWFFRPRPWLRPRRTPTMNAYWSSMNSGVR